MKKILIIFILSGFFMSCEDFLDVNTDPNNPTEVGPDLVLPVAQNFTARWMHGDRRVSHLGNMIMYNWSESAGYSWYNDEFQYRANATTFYAAVFNEGYNDVLKQYSDLDDLDTEVYGAYVAISKIMKAYHFQILVDFYGDIPYSEALQRSLNSNPAYDNGQAIYDDLIVELTEAIELLSAAEASDLSVLPEVDDIIFGGDLTSWKRFANTIKLRILTRESDVKDDAYINQELAVIATEGSGFITADVTVDPGYLDEENKQNPFWEDFGAGPDGTPTLTSLATSATDYIIDYLTNTSDPRIDYIYEEPATGHLGVPQGITADPAIYHSDLVSNIGPGILIGPGQSSVIFTLAERYFNEAELALKGFGGDPEALYNTGVEASFVGLGLSAADAATYLTQSTPLISYAASPEKLEAIITQKWIALNGMTAEQSWFDWSRTGFPADLPISQEVPNLVRPVRLSYPASEVGANAANVPTQPNVFDSKVFWAN